MQEIDLSNSDTYLGLISEDGKYKCLIKEQESFIGRDESCNFQINDDFLSSRHAKIQIIHGQVFLEDLGSTNGIFVNGERTESVQLKIGDIVQIGKTKFKLKEQKIKKKKNEGTNFFKVPGKDVQTSRAQDLVKVKLDKKSVTGDQTAFIQLDKIQFEEEFDEDVYIFEEDEDIYPILELIDETYLEIIKMYKDTIISMDYVESDDSDIYAVGEGQEGDVHLDTISTGSNLPLIKVKEGGKMVFSPIKGHENYIVRNGKVHQVKKATVIKSNDLMKIKKGHYSINLKFVDAEQVIGKEPFGGRDRSFKLLVISSLVFSVLVYMLSLLYTPKKKVVEKKEKVKKTFVIYKKPKKKVEVVKKEVIKEPKPEPPKKVEKVTPQTSESIKTKKKPEKIEKKVVRKVQKTKKKPQKVETKRRVRNKTNKVVKSQNKNIKKVDTFSDFNFSNDLKSLKTTKTVAKNFGTKSAETLGAQREAGGLNVGTVSVARSGDANAKVEIGSAGVVANSSGLGTFGTNKNIDFKKSYGKTVLLGSIDPEIIRELLRRNLPQFRYCYDDELRRQNKRVSGKMDIDFVIGPNGRVGRSAIGLKAFSMSSSGKNCMRKVLQAIKFPRPKGGGVVEVKQPIFLEPN